MDHEEITTKIELQPAKAETNIVHINFAARNSVRNAPKRRASDQRQSEEVAPLPTTWVDKVKALDLSSPWVLRLVAVLTVLILSLLVL